MNPSQILPVLKARYKVALLAMLAAVGIAQAASNLLPKQYIATTSLVVDLRPPDPVVEILMPRNVATQVEIISSNRVAQKVVRHLKLDENPAMKERWLTSTEGKGNLEIWIAELLKKGLLVKPSRDSTIIYISFTAADPVYAATVANAFAQAYLDATIELKVEPARQYARWFSDQGRMLRENLEKAQARVSAFQQKKGIVSRDELMDSETAKLRDLSQQLTSVQTEMTSIQSKQRSGQSADTLKEVMQNPLITSLKTEIARQEAKLREIALNLGRNHPQYLRMESEIAALKQQVEEETRHVTRSLTTSRSVSRGTETQLKAAIEAQKKRLLELKSERDQLAVLQRDVDAAQGAYDAVIRRLNQTTLESQITQANVSVLTPAVEPTEPLTAKLFRSPLITIILGILVGVCAAIGLEMIDKRVRSVHDLAEMLQVPVLGVIGNGRKRGTPAIAQRSTALLTR